MSKRSSGTTEEDEDKIIKSKKIRYGGLHPLVMTAASDSEPEENVQKDEEEKHEDTEDGDNDSDNGRDLDHPNRENPNSPKSRLYLYLDSDRDNDSGNDNDEEESRAPDSAPRGKRVSFSEFIDSDNGDNDSDNDNDNDEEENKIPDSAPRGKRASFSDSSHSLSGPQSKAMMAAFFHYAHANRTRVEKKVNEKRAFVHVATLLYEDFRNLSRNEQEEWLKTAVHSGIRYTDEMKSYEASKPTRKAKDIDAPRRFKSAFLFYSMETRHRLKDENPSASFGDLSKLTSAGFQALPKEEQARYQEMAKQDRERYLREMKEYNRTKKES